jgi:precorrin-8X/cobalt-precorrin-8 methylmutase
MINYLRDPERIHQQNYAQIRELADLSAFTPEQQQIVIHMISAYGELGLAQRIQFSANAIQAACKAIKRRNNILYDEVLVNAALDSSLLSQEPLGFLNKAAVISLAKANKQTRAMAAVEYWKPYMQDSIILIGQSGTALFRLLELLKEGAPRPALVVAAARGFINAETAKQLLWNQHEELGFECIVVSGTCGGGVLAAMAMNALLMIQQGKNI